MGGRTTVSIAQKSVPGRPAQRYVPDTGRAAKELSVQEWTSLDQGIRRTIQWHQQKKQ